MSFAPTFGSLGDFVTVCQLATQLGKALGDGYGGSSSEYQELRGGLDTLVQVLTHVRGFFLAFMFFYYLPLTACSIEGGA
jgi:hypothetical protein